MINSLEVCVAVPFFNEEAYLMDTLISLSSQSLVNFRAVLLDNSSTDGSSAIAKKIAQEDTRFEYHRASSNKGNLTNFLWGLEMCREPYFMWLGGHDLISENYLHELTKALGADSSLSFAYSSHDFISEGGAVIEEEPSNSAKFSHSERAQRRFIESIGALVVDSSPLHAVFRSSAIEGVNKYVIHSQFSWDHSILSYASYFGKAVYSNKAVYSRRVFEKRASTNLSRTQGDRKVFPNKSMINLINVYCLVWLQCTKFSFLGMMQVPRIVFRVKKRFSIKLLRNLANLILTFLRNNCNPLSRRCF